MSSPDDHFVIPQVTSENTLFEFKDKKPSRQPSNENMDPEYFLHRANRFDSYDEEKDGQPVHAAPNGYQPVATVYPAGHPNGPAGNCHMGNFAALAILSFAVVTALLATNNLFLPDKPNNIIFPTALVFGGFAQVVAGFMCFFRGNTFGGTLFVSYGAFWLGNGMMMHPGLHSAYDAYKTVEDLNTANAYYHFVWAIYTVINIGISLVVRGGNFLLTFNLFFVFCTLFLEGFFYTTGHIVILRISGVTAYLAAIGAFYSGVVDILEEQGVVLWTGVYKKK
ncbi:GPR1/FUN34/yaaH family-domain-containing protein [Phycomyces nitens]|nr:GPR1/FUN34/yaaH family-domain-containing protein [Phycomyces nitens]